ncbi:unnamed protein product [Lymnaea stagnalis]|uniref:AIG1-type G domain-containing protein n=1 Tax=Lymnaea stagnalis TaxID=6523 RepID=A0AAV2IHM9_LYMST
MLTNILSDLHKQMESIQKTFEGSEYYNSLWTPLQTRLLNVRSQLKILEGGRSEYTRVEEVSKSHREQETNSQPYRSLPEPSRQLSNNILPSDNKSAPIDGAYQSLSPQTLPEETRYVKDRVLLLVGRTGCGKSSTANSIIGEPLFAKKGEDSSLLQKYAVDIDGSKVTVVDGTGIGDTGSDMTGGLQETIQKAETAVQLCVSGFNALIYVMAYGTRFIQKEKESVDLIKSLFGRDILFIYLFI